MSIVKVSNNIYSVGVMNPALRVFDIVMRSPFGTSYNSYLITGTKNVLVETVHSDFFEEYIYNVGSLIDIANIDYIVMNHTELDHSGSLSKLLDMNPNLIVICTAVAQKYLRSILNRDFKCIPVKNGDSLDIGNCKLNFIVAPLLHWPDSMMTYVENDNVLFSCDFLGCHFCEPAGTDESIHYKNEYLIQFKHYFNGIFGPFKPYVLSGIERIKNLTISAICPSHGPIITSEINERINDYISFCNTPEKSKKSVAIIYASAYKCTKLLAKAAFNVIKEQTDFNPVLIDVVSTDFAKTVENINSCDALLVGSCTINRDAPKIIWDVLSSIDVINIKGKPAGAFGSFGWSGEAVSLIKDRLCGIKYNFIGDGFKVNFMPTDEDLNNMKNYALEIVNNVK